MRAQRQEALFRAIVVMGAALTSCGGRTTDRPSTDTSDQRIDADPGPGADAEPDAVNVQDTMPVAEASVDNDAPETLAVSDSAEESDAASNQGALGDAGDGDACIDLAPCCAPSPRCCRPYYDCIR
jgi:hypothetical protein